MSVRILVKSGDETRLDNTRRDAKMKKKICELSLFCILAISLSRVRVPCEAHLRLAGCIQTHRETDLGYI